MANGNVISRESEFFGQSGVIKRSRLFFTVPVIIIGILTVNLAWEIVRGNLPAHTLISWPFRFTVISNATTATVLAVFISLFMGRLQWARALRPIVGVAIDDEGAKFKPDSDVWRVWLYNSGPGGAVIESISYYVRFTDQPEGAGEASWVKIKVVNDQLQSRRLVDGKDYFIRWYARGAPFPAVKHYSESMQIAYFTVKALASMRILDIRVRYVDSLGDVHEKVTPIMHRLPSVANSAMKSASKAPSNP
jgi:hypothetical protein